MAPKEQQRLQHMLDAAIRIRELTICSARSEIEFDAAKPFALLALFQIIGEAARNVSDEIRQAESEIDWRGWIGFRNRLTHSYFDVDFDVLWDAVNNDIPSLIATLLRIVDQSRLDS